MSGIDWDTSKEVAQWHFINLSKGGYVMKAGVIFTGTGPILVLTSYNSFEDPKFIAKLRVKGIEKFIASELPLDKVRAKYGNHYHVVMGDLKQADDLRVLDYNGHNVFYSFEFSDMSKAFYHEGDAAGSMMSVNREVA
ncbi:MAG: hypothetical protein V2J25_00440 [Desulfatiglans sp.]|nr:hypothetical protein [Desulfatiglans sp.]